jgi:predicted transcriptional regulator
MESTNLDNSEVYPELAAEQREELRKQFNRDAVEAWEHYQATGLHLTDEELGAWIAKLEAGEDAPFPECHT